MVWGRCLSCLRPGPQVNPTFWNPAKNSKTPTFLGGVLYQPPPPKVSSLKCRAPAVKGQSLKSTSIFFGPRAYSRTSNHIACTSHCFHFQYQAPSCFINMPPTRFRILIFRGWLQAWQQPPTSKDLTRFRTEAVLCSLLSYDTLFRLEASALPFRGRQQNPNKTEEHLQRQMKRQSSDLPFTSMWRQCAPMM